MRDAPKMSTCRCYKARRMGEPLHVVQPLAQNVQTNANTGPSAAPSRCLRVYTATTSAPSLLGDHYKADQILELFRAPRHPAEDHLALSFGKCRLGTWVRTRIHPIVPFTCSPSLSQTSSDRTYEKQHTASWLSRSSSNGALDVRRAVSVG